MFSDMRDEHILRGGMGVGWGWDGLFFRKQNQDKQ